DGRGQARARHDGLDWMRTPRLDDPQAGCKARFAAQEQRERVRIDRGAVDLASADEPDRLDMRAGLAEHPKEWGATDVAEPAQKIEIAGASAIATSPAWERTRAACCGGDGSSWTARVGARALALPVPGRRRL